MFIFASKWRDAGCMLSHISSVSWILIERGPISILHRVYIHVHVHVQLEAFTWSKHFLALSYLCYQNPINHAAHWSWQPFKQPCWQELPWGLCICSTYSTDEFADFASNADCCCFSWEWCLPTWACSLPLQVFLGCLLQGPHTQQLCMCWLQVIHECGNKTWTPIMGFVLSVEQSLYLEPSVPHLQWLHHTCVQSAPL